MKPYGARIPHVDFICCYCECCRGSLKDGFIHNKKDRKSAKAKERRMNTVESFITGAPLEDFYPFASYSKPGNHISVYLQDTPTYHNATNGKLVKFICVKTAKFVGCKIYLDERGNKMGWIGGSNLFLQIWKPVRGFIPSDKRLEVCKLFVQCFEDCDADNLFECFSEDCPEIELAARELHPEDFEDLED